MTSGEGDLIRLALPADPRYLDVALVAATTLAERAGIDPRQLGTLRDRVLAALRERIEHPESEGGPAPEPVVLVFDLGDGYLGVRVEESQGSRR